MLRQILLPDPLSPLLAEPHYEAIDRRLKHILVIIKECIEKHGETDVVVVDKYSSQYADELESS